MAHLCDGSRLHVHRDALVHVSLDVLHLFLMLDELVARSDDTDPHPSVFHVARTERSLAQGWFGMKELGTSLHLPETVARPAVHIVVDDLLAHHHIHHADTLINGTGHTGIQDTVWLVTPDKFHRSYGSIHFADATLCQYHLVAADGTFDILEGRFPPFRLVFQKLRQLFVFHRQGDNDSYFHVKC